MRCSAFAAPSTKNRSCWACCFFRSRPASRAQRTWYPSAGPTYPVEGAPSRLGRASLPWHRVLGTRCSVRRIHHRANSEHRPLALSARCCVLRTQGDTQRSSPVRRRSAVDGRLTAQERPSRIEPTDATNKAQRRADALVTRALIAKATARRR